MPLPFSPGFTNQFGQTVSAAYPSYASYTISSTTPNQTISLGWATTFQNVPNVVAQIMDVTVTASTAGTIQLPDATQASVGTDFVINNYSDSQSINIVDATGSVLFEISVQSAGSTESSSALIYLSDNSTTGGTWHYINYGGVAGGFNPANVAGPGLEVSTINPEELMVNLAVQSFVADTDFNAENRAVTMVFTGSSSATVKLPPVLASDIGNGYFVTILNNYQPNAGAAPTITVNPSSPGAATFNGGATTYSMPFGAEVTFYCDGTGWWTFRGNKGGSDAATFPDGNAPAPGIAFTNQTGTGFFRYTTAASNQAIGFSVNGVQQGSVLSNGQVSATNLFRGPLVVSNTLNMGLDSTQLPNQAFLKFSGSNLQAWYLPSPTDGIFIGWQSPSTGTISNITIGANILAPAANTYFPGSTRGLQAQNLVAINGLYAGSTASGANGKLYINGIPLDIYLRASGF
jgi:hypothetical protein